jgi:hypothetical protein
MIASHQPPHPHTTDDLPIFRLLTHASPSRGVISTHHSPPTLILTFSTVSGLTDESSGSFDSHSAFVTNDLSLEAKLSRDCICDVKDCEPDILSWDVVDGHRLENGGAQSYLVNLIPCGVPLKSLGISMTMSYRPLSLAMSDAPGPSSPSSTVPVATSSGRESPELSYVVISGGTGANSIATAFGTSPAFVLPVSDDGGSSAEILRCFGGPSIGDIRELTCHVSDTS